MVFRFEAASVVAADFNGESVVEAERRAHGQVEALRIFGLDLASRLFRFDSRTLCGFSLRTAVSAVPVYSG